MVPKTQQGLNLNAGWTLLPLIDFPVDRPLVKGWGVGPYFYCSSEAPYCVNLVMVDARKGNELSCAVRLQLCTLYVCNGRSRRTGHVPTRGVGLEVESPVVRSSRHHPK